MAATLHGCLDAPDSIHLNRVNLQFSRRAVVVEVDGEPRYRPTRDDEGNDQPPQKRVVISNSSSQPIPLRIRIEGPQASAFDITTAPSAEDEPFNYRVDPEYPLDLAVQFQGAGGVVGTNRARVIIEGGKELDESGWSYREAILLEGVADCISMGLDADEDGYCDTDSLFALGGDTALGDCDDEVYAINPGQDERCDEGDQVDNDCDGSTVNVVDVDGDGWCDLETSCAADLQDLAAHCQHTGPTLQPWDPDEQYTHGVDHDCNDDAPGLHPTQAEACEPGGPSNQLDNNCDSGDDLSFLVSYWPDIDGDGYGEAGSDAVQRCGTVPQGMSNNEDDCDDNNPAVFAGAEEICDGLDNDCDGCQGTAGDSLGGLPTGCVGTSGLEVSDDYDVDLDGRPACGRTPEGDPLDCDDTNPLTYRGAAELCDGEDNDCVGGGPTDEVDADGDGYASCAAEVWVPGTPFQLEADCDDSEPSAHPGGTETACDSLDNDCDGRLHPSETDMDGDGQTSCGVAGLDLDCDDSNPWIFSGAPEWCDALDTDCDGVLPLDERDLDGDGYVACTEELQPWPTGYAGVVGHAGGGDCADDPTAPLLGGSAGDIYPGAPEISDSYAEWNESSETWELVLVDNQCPGDPGYDAVVDVDPFEPDPGQDAAGNQEYCVDSTSNPVCPPGAACFGCTGNELDEDGDGFTEARGDCDDDDPLRGPWTPEVCDGIDNDCDGVLSAMEIDVDGDGYVQCWPGPDLAWLLGGDCAPSDGSVHPGMEEIEGDGIDNDCDSSTVEPASVDADGDGYTADVDCDDTDPATWPGAPELCDGLDGDCDGQLGDGAALQPDGASAQPDERDLDGDGYTVCGDADCDDTDAGVNPGLSNCP